MDLRASDWEKIEQDESGCWIWTGCVSAEGYGRVRRQGNVYDAHRYVWLCIRGQHDQGLELDHLCRVRSCVNPDHLEPVTHWENVSRGVSPAARNARRTHCEQGHEFDTVVRRKGRPEARGCSSCIAARARAYAARKRSA